MTLRSSMIGFGLAGLVLFSASWAPAQTAPVEAAPPASAPAPTPVPVPVPPTIATTADAKTPVDAAAGAPVQATIPTPVPVIFSNDTATPPAVVAQAPETLSARTLVRLDQMTRELAETIGRVEALEGALVAQKAENERLSNLLVQTQANQASPPKAAEATPLTTTPSAAEAPALFVAPTPPPLSPALMLVNAQSALQAGNYTLAEANLSQLIWVHPTSAEASEGRWLLGEARFVQSAWGNAAQAYVDYLKASPTGPRASEALLRLAGSFRQLGDNRQRCVALAEFKRRTPRPDPTLKARADAEIARTACPTA